MGWISEKKLPSQIRYRQGRIRRNIIDNQYFGEIPAARFHKIRKSELHSCKKQYFQIACAAYIAQSIAHTSAEDQIK